MACGTFISVGNNQVVIKISNVYAERTGGRRRAQPNKLKDKFLVSVEAAWSKEKQDALGGDISMTTGRARIQPMACRVTSA